VKTADGGGLSHRSKWLTFSLALILVVDRLPGWKPGPVPGGSRGPEQ